MYTTFTSFNSVVARGDALLICFLYFVLDLSFFVVAGELTHVSFIRIMEMRQISFRQCLSMTLYKHSTVGRGVSINAHVNHPSWNFFIYKITTSRACGPNKSTFFDMGLSDVDYITESIYTEYIKSPKKSTTYSARFILNFDQYQRVKCLSFSG